MSQSNVITGSDSTPIYRVRKIGPADLKDALAKGLADSAKPSHLVFLGLIYPLADRAVVGAFRSDFPLLSGFALIGPLRALLYEISQARDLASNLVEITYSPWCARIRYSHPVARPLILVIFGCWLFAAQALYVSPPGPAPPQSFTQFITTISTRRKAGADRIRHRDRFVFAVLALSLSVVSFPMLLRPPNRCCRP